MEATSDACVLVCPDPVAMWFGLMHVLHAPPSRTIDVPSGRVPEFPELGVIDSGTGLSFANWRPGRSGHAPPGWVALQQEVQNP